VSMGFLDLSNIANVVHLIGSCSEMLRGPRSPRTAEMIKLYLRARRLVPFAGAVSLSLVTRGYYRAALVLTWFSCTLLYSVYRLEIVFFFPISRFPSKMKLRQIYPIIGLPIKHLVPGKRKSFTMSHERK
jgi:hypothetical protein